MINQPYRSFTNAENALEIGDLTYVRQNLLNHTNFFSNLGYNLFLSLFEKWPLHYNIDGIIAYENIQHSIKKW